MTEPIDTASAIKAIAKGIHKGEGWHKTDGTPIPWESVPEEHGHYFNGAQGALQAIKEITNVYDRIELILSPEDDFTLSQSNGVIMLDSAGNETESVERTSPVYSHECCLFMYCPNPTICMNAPEGHDTGCVHRRPEPVN